MIKNYSINIKAIILLSIVFFICILFLILLKINTYNKEERFKQELIKNFNFSNEKNISSVVADMNNSFNLIQNPNLIKSIRNNTQLAFKNNENECILYSLQYKGDLYFDISCKDFNALYKQNTNNKVYNLFLATLFFFFLLLYLWLLKFLKDFKKQIIEDKNDKNFDQVNKIAFKKNQESIKSRQLFILMHELKTPISKGRIISEMLKEDKQKKRLVKIFLHMDSLINELGKIENLFSKTYKLQLKPYYFDTILKKAKEHLMRDDFKKIVKVDLKYDALISVDIEIFSLVLKNLIDNALKHSNTNTCELVCYKEYFIVKNEGKALIKPIKHYLKAFTRENTQVQGMGLGLYIVSQACKLHGFDLLYFYVEGKHCFKIFFGDKKNNGK